jgi:hypothetical protein
MAIVDSEGNGDTIDIDNNERGTKDGVLNDHRRACIRIKVDIWCDARIECPAQLASGCVDRNHCAILCRKNSEHKI